MEKARTIFFAFDLLFFNIESRKARANYFAFDHA